MSSNLNHRWRVHYQYYYTAAPTTMYAGWWTDAVYILHSYWPVPTIMRLSWSTARWWAETLEGPSLCICTTAMRHCCTAGRAIGENCWVVSTDTREPAIMTVRHGTTHWCTRHYTRCFTADLSGEYCRVMGRGTCGARHGTAVLQKERIANTGQRY